MHLCICTLFVCENCKNQFEIAQQQVFGILKRPYASRQASSERRRAKRDTDDRKRQPLYSPPLEHIQPTIRAKNSTLPPPQSLT